MSGPRNPLAQATHTIRRGALRRSLVAIAAGKSDDLSIKLDDKTFDAASVVDDVAKPFAIESIELQRLVAAFRNSGAADAVVDGMAAKPAATRRQSARIAGALRLAGAVSWLSPLLASKDRSVCDAAARALGRIGGPRSAQALLLAIQRAGMRRTFIAELARAAPDLFLEVALSEPQRPGVKPAIALAVGLRRRQTAVGPLLALLMHGSRRERAISCRALGWIGSPAAIAPLNTALSDPETKVRVAAAKALRGLNAGRTTRLKPLSFDRNHVVRIAAGEALRTAESGVTAS